MKYVWLVGLGLFVFPFYSVAGISRYFSDTYASLECMHQGTALVPDKVFVLPGNGPCPIHVSPLPTSPSNIALDLLVQLEALELPELKIVAEANLVHTLQILQKIPRYLPLGLFYVRYTVGSNRQLPSVVDPFLSSIDNLHIAYALWAVSQTGPPEARSAAKALFSAMNFDFFYDSQDGLFVGGARMVKGRPVWEKWKYRYLGSEARSLYAIGWALGLVHDPDFIAKSTRSLEADLYTWNEPGQGVQELLSLWDGGAFQLLLPRLLISEELYSPQLGKMFRAYGQYVLEEGRRLGYPVPASHSACQFDLTTYLGRAGSVALVSPRDVDITDPGLREDWDKVFTPHAAFLAAPFLAHEFLVALEAAESVIGPDGVPLYRRGLGWMDALYVRGRDAGRVIPVQLSLDQAMIALATSDGGSERPMTAGARQLYLNRETRSRLDEFYRALNGVLRR